MVFTPELFTNNRTRSTMTTPTLKKSSARKSLCLFTNILDVKNRTFIRRVGADKSNCEAIRAANTPWVLKSKKK